VLPLPTAAMNRPAPLESALAIDCAGTRLWGVLTRPAPGVTPISTAVLIVVGGPQYRVGSHRQFVQLARALARHGYASLRFDYRGMGDSDGDLRSFDQARDDVRAGLDALVASQPASARIVVWGLCDAAAAALMFATGDPRVRGVVAANPWARSAASLGAARVKHYYAARLLQGEFWRKLLGGGFDWRSSLASLRDNLAQATRHYRGNAGSENADDDRNASFQTRMARGLGRFRGRVLLMISEADLTALEFLQYTAADAAWKGLLQTPAVQRIDIPEADHTFSRRVWAERAEAETVAWLQRHIDPSEDA
jgi:exosortase A-associated hydrolase 1